VAIQAFCESNAHCTLSDTAQKPQQNSADISRIGQLLSEDLRMTNDDTSLLNC